MQTAVIFCACFILFFSWSIFYLIFIVNATASMLWDPCNCILYCDESYLYCSCYDVFVYCQDVMLLDKLYLCLNTYILSTQSSLFVIFRTSNAIESLTIDNSFFSCKYVGDNPKNSHPESAHECHLYRNSVVTTDFLYLEIDVIKLPRHNNHMMWTTAVWGNPLWHNGKHLYAIQTRPAIAFPPFQMIRHGKIVIERS